MGKGPFVDTKPVCPGIVFLHIYSVSLLSLPKWGKSIPVYMLEGPALLAKQKPYQVVIKKGVCVCSCV